MTDTGKYTIAVDVYTRLGHKSVLILSGETLDELIEKFPSAISTAVVGADLIGETNRLHPELLKKWTEDKENGRIA